MIMCFDLRTGTGCGAQNVLGAQYCNQCRKPLRFALALRDPGDMIGSLRVVKILGHGGFGVVYQVEDTRNGAHIALKETFDSANIASFRSEFEVLKNTRHPNLPRYYDMFEMDDNGFLMMEFVPGQSLDDILQRRQEPLLESQVLGYALQICDALIYLHSLHPPIIHRDIKPANVRLTPEGLIKLVDFGLLKQGTEATAHSRRGLTPAYAPIEQWGGTQHTDTRSDMYSLGATLYHCLSGQEPPTATDRISVNHDPLMPLRQRNPQISDPVATAITTALEIQQRNRYRDVATLKLALQGTVHTSSVLRSAAPAPAVVPRTPAPAPIAQPAARPATPPVVAAGTPTFAIQPQPVTLTSVFGAALPGITLNLLLWAAFIALLASFSCIAGNLGLFFLSWLFAFFVAVKIYTSKGRTWLMAVFATVCLGPLAVALALITPPLVNKQLIFQDYSRRRNNLLALIIVPLCILIAVTPGFIFLLLATSATITEYIFVSKRHKPFWMFVPALVLGPLAVLIVVVMKPTGHAAVQHP